MRKILLSKNKKKNNNKKLLGQKESWIEILWTLTNSIRKKKAKINKERRKKAEKTIAEYYHKAHVTNSQTIHNKLSWAKEVVVLWD